MRCYLLQVFTLLVFARVWTRMLELLLPMGFFMLLVSTVPQLFSYILLVKLLDGDEKVSLEVSCRKRHAPLGCALPGCLMWDPAGCSPAAGWHRQDTV